MPLRISAWAKQNSWILWRKESCPKPVPINGLKIWDRLELDAAFEAVKEAALDAPIERNNFDNILQLKR